MRAVIYSRVSHTDQVENGSSLDTQHNQILSFCEYKNMEIVEHFTDAGISGRKYENRPNFVRMMQRVERGGINAVVVYSLSRFGRNIRDTLNYLDKLDKLNVSFYAIDLNIDTSTSHGKLVLQIMSALSEFESNQMSDRIKVVMQNNKDKKRTYCGNPPYGFENFKGTLRPIQSEMDIVHKAHELRNKEGLSYHKIAKYFNDQNIPTRSGGKFYAVTIEKIIKNGIYKDQLSSTA
jgi:site-specific DNA recombinase